MTPPNEKEEMELVGGLVPVSHARRLEAMADADARSKSFFLRQALDEYFERLDKEAGLKEAA